MTESQMLDYLQDDHTGMEDARMADEAWKIDNDRAADWAVRRVKENRSELARLEELADAQVARIMEKVREEQDKTAKRNAYLIQLLNDYAVSLGPDGLKETKTQYKYKLLSGELIITKAKEAMEVADEAALLAYLDADLPDYVKVTKKPMWGEYKKQLAITGGHVIDRDTGEIIPGVEVVEKPSSFDVK